MSGSVAQELGDGGPGRRIAFYSSANLNVLDGSSIWIEAVCATLLADPANRVVLPLKVAERRDLITASLRALGRVELVPPPPGTHANRGLKTTEVLDRIEQLDREEPFDALLLRSFDVCLDAVARPRLRGRVMSCYVLEPERDLGDPSHIADLRRITDGSRFVVCQSEEMRSLFEALVPEAVGRTILLPPAIPETPLVPRPDPTAIVPRMLYTGKFHPFYPVELMVRFLTELRREMPELEFHVAGDKIRRMPNDPNYAPALERALSTTRGVVWHGGLSRVAVERLLAEGGVALSLWDYRFGSDINDLVISTKLLDYCSVGLPVILNRTAAQEAMLGPDYPLFVDDPADALPLLRRVLADRELYEATSRRTVEATRPFTYRAVYERLRPALEVSPPAPDRAALIARRPKLQGATCNVAWLTPRSGVAAVRPMVELVDRLRQADDRFRLIVGSLDDPPGGHLAGGDDPVGPGGDQPAALLPAGITADGKVARIFPWWLRKVGAAIVEPGIGQDALESAVASGTALFRIATDDPTDGRGLQPDGTKLASVDEIVAALTAAWSGRDRVPESGSLTPSNPPDRGQP